VATAVSVLNLACGDQTIDPASGESDQTLRFSIPFSTAVEGNTVFVTDTGNHTINLIDLATGTSTVLAGARGTAGVDDGVPPNARFNFPKSVVVIGPDLFVADSGNFTVRKIVRATGETTTLAGSPGQSSGPIDGIGADARFGSPKVLAADGQDVLYVADAFNNAVRRITISTAEVSTVVDQTAGLSNPQGLAATDQYVYIADTNHQVIRRMEKSTGQLSRIAGREGISGAQDGDGAVATFFHPHGLAVSGAYLYVADSDNHTIRRIDLTSDRYSVSTVSGWAGLVGSTDGVATTARFNNPEGVSTDGTTLFVADTFNSVIRRIDLATGTVTTLPHG
jgi:sugar lactone lactonase YvrE